MICCRLRENKKEFVITKPAVKAKMKIKIYKADLRFSTSAKYFLGGFKTSTSIVS